MLFRQPARLGKMNLANLLRHLGRNIFMCGGISNRRAASVTTVNITGTRTISGR